MQDWESNAFGLLLILADNYNLTTNNFTTETRSAQRTHRDFLAERSVACYNCDPCGQLAAAPGSRSTVCGAAALVAACGLGPFGLAALTSGRAGFPKKSDRALVGPVEILALFFVIDFF